ncbi:kinase-interacting protein 1-like [Diospyros lotus]|uniref:kinase-interacting protein 1-like n=1 Tax=Diospyros lotus TaxID=55363 RepID=UPI00224F3944|nr:kinase-interacting protein 1-like [Diospyros lotus]
MLQRAASNAYSWASHVRTKQSTWLKQSLQDMEEKVQSVLKLIEEDGDSFAKRAEMYCKKRPELIHFVEESYQAYQALAERYDHISTELQHANTTIATVFPERVQFAMDEEDGYGSPRVSKNIPKSLASNVLKVPSFHRRDLNGLQTTSSKKQEAAKSSKASNKIAPKTGSSKSETVEEINKLQKEILILQTEEEFEKSSYEGGLAKYWEIENWISELQERVFSLQEEFSEGKVIEDDEAWILKAKAALQSCQETLAQWQQKQEKTTKGSGADFKRIENAWEKLNSSKHKFNPDQQADEENPNNKYESANTGGKPQILNSKVGSVTNEGQELDMLIEKTIEHSEVDSKEFLTVKEMEEKNDDLANKVINLESAVSSETALVHGLRRKTDGLQEKIQTLEDEKSGLVDGTNNLTVDDKLNRIQDLNQNVETQNSLLQTHFTEAYSSLHHLSEKLHCMKPDEELTGSFLADKSSVRVKPPEEMEKQEYFPALDDSSRSSGRLKLALTEDKNGHIINLSVNSQGEKVKEKSQLHSNADMNIIYEKQEDTKSLKAVDKHGILQTEDNVINTQPQEVAIEKEEEPDLQGMLLNQLEDRENFLTEYTTLLRNYKGMRKKLSEVENKSRQSISEMTLQLREQRSTIAMRDREILTLHQKLKLLHEIFNENMYPKEDNRMLSTLLDDQNTKPVTTEELKVNGALEIPPAMKEEEEEDIKLIPTNQPQLISPIEEKLRTSIDALLDEHLDFWFRFSASYHQVQKFESWFLDLKAELAEVQGKNVKGGTKTYIKSDPQPIHKHLTEIQTELTLWIEQSASLKDELWSRFSSLHSIREEIMKALKEGAEEEEIKFTSHEAAKFNGEVLNMQQENNKVRKELQAGLDRVTTLQQEILRTLTKLKDEFRLFESNNNCRTKLRHLKNQSQVPLGSFIFRSKRDKRLSVSSCIQIRKYCDLRASPPM